MEESEPDYKSRQEAILEYIRKNPDCTKADVIRHMLGKSAVTTTHSMLKDLIKQGKVKVYKKNIQLHQLSLNEDHEFFKLNNMLNELETFTNKMEAPIRKIEKAIGKLETASDKQIVGRREEVSRIVELTNSFIFPYESTLEDILRSMLIRIIKSNLSQKDRQILTLRVQNLFNKIKDITHHGRMVDEDSFLKNRISIIRKTFAESKHIQDYTEKYDIDVNIIEELISMIEKFRTYYRLT